MRRTRRTVVALLALVLAAAGCTGTTAPRGDGADGSGTRVKSLDINPQPRDRLRDGGSLVWALSEFPTQWNDHHLNGAEASAAFVVLALMPAPFRFNDRAEPILWTDYVSRAVLTSRAPQTLTYTLNPRARWSDGTPITFRDYVAQWRALNGRNPAYQAVSTTGYELIGDVRRGRDDHEVVVTFDKPYGDWRGLFSPLYPASTNRDADTFNKGWINRIRTTAGPFRFEGFDQAAKTVSVVRDPNWWGDRAKLDRIVFKALQSDASIAAFANGEIDYLPTVTANASNYEQVKSARGGVVREAAGPDFRHFTFNGTSPVLTDPIVRRAIAKGIDRQALARADLTGLDWPVQTMDNHFFVNTQAGYQDNSGDLGRYDPDRARQLLDQAGWKLSGQVRQKGGRTLTVRFVIPAGLSTSRNEAELAQAMLREIGVVVDIRSVPSDDFFDKYVIPGNFDVAPFSWLGTPFLSSSKSIYQKPARSANGDLVVRQNFARVGSSDIDRLLAQASSELDVPRSRRLYNEADKLVWDEVHSLTLFQRPQIAGVKQGLANLGSFGFATRVYEDIGYEK